MTPRSRPAYRDFDSDEEELPLTLALALSGKLTNNTTPKPSTPSTPKPKPSQTTPAKRLAFKPLNLPTTSTLSTPTLGTVTPAKLRTASTTPSAFPDPPRLGFSTPITTTATTPKFPFRSHRSRLPSVIPDSEDERLDSDHDDEDNAVPAVRPPLQRLHPLLLADSFANLSISSIISDSEDDGSLSRQDENEGNFSGVVRSNEGREKDRRRKARVSLCESVVISDSEEEREDEGAIEPSGARTKCCRDRSRIGNEDNAVVGGKTEVEVIYLSSDSEGDGSGNASDGVRSFQPTPRARKPPPKLVVDPSSDEDDAPTGILSYVPTPHKRPTKLNSPGRRLGGTRIFGVAAINSESDQDSDSVLTTVRPPSTPLRRPTTPTPNSRPKPTRLTRPPSTAITKQTATLLTAKQRETLPLALIRELDRSVFRKYGEGGVGLPEGLGVTWSNRLRNTAGRATMRKGKCSVELATKVCDTEAKLSSTLAHELCHVAAWVLSKEMKPPHGPAFKLWAKRVMAVRPDLEVTTTHSYEIAYKYRWACTSLSCSRVFSRHSNSIDPTTHGCPCGGSLAALNKDGLIKTTTEATTKKTDYQLFVAASTPNIKRDHPGIKQSDVMKAVAALWRAKKEREAGAGSLSGAIAIGGGNAEESLECALEGLVV